MSEDTSERRAHPARGRVRPAPAGAAHRRRRAAHPVPVVLHRARPLRAARPAAHRGHPAGGSVAHVLAGHRRGGPRPAQPQHLRGAQRRARQPRLGVHRLHARHHDRAVLRLRRRQGRHGDDARRRRAAVVPDDRAGAVPDRRDRSRAVGAGARHRPRDDAVDGPLQSRHRPGAAQPRVRRGGAPGRCLAAPGAPSPRAAQLAADPPGRGERARRQRGAHLGVAQLPRPRRPAARSELGEHAALGVQRGVRGTAVRARAGRVRHDRRRRLHPHRRGPAPQVPRRRLRRRRGARAGTFAPAAGALG